MMICCLSVCLQISMASLCVVEELLQKPHKDILNILVLRNLESRSYLLLPPAGLEDGHAESSEPAEDSEYERTPRLHTANMIQQHRHENTQPHTSQHNMTAEDLSSGIH